MKPKPVFLAFAILTIFIGCPSKKDTTVPDELLGVWKTSAPKYADRYFEITKGVMIFDIGEGDVDSSPITSIETVSGGRHTLYTISYQSYQNREGQEYRFSFYYDSAHGGEIVFKNQEDITWTKERR